ncbi:hypothetical protein WN51_07800 [Melipona quadrifasciata]|uniref:Uncharacterized protein n=1 Tax=Melipona quadrifasciata TaxID=166423 RepID=A0A0M9A901_9HYME|nr:hypothetical protein WN51_07800 [Melipona quadrifasciata]
MTEMVNSTLDWSPIKWSNKLEQIWNLSLSQGTLIFDTVGEDTIKTVLSWIVITRIVIAHLYTFSYMINLYPILTSRRPNLLLPWLILSFFKNVVLEVIVIAVGLLLWYDKRFSLTIFVEFVLVKVVPLIVFSYIWYSNSCLFLEQRHLEKMRKLKRMRSDTNLIVSRLCSKLADSKYRTRSLTTLISCESYETYESSDTISRIIDDPGLTPGQKTARILGLTDQDIADARVRIKERAVRKRLSEEDDDSLEGAAKRDVSRYFFDKYDWNVLKDSRKEDERPKRNVDEVAMEEDKKDEIAANEREESEIAITDESTSDEVTNGSEIKAEDRVATDETTSDKNENETGDRVTMDEITNDEIADKNPTLKNPSLASIQRSPTMEKEGTDFPETKQTELHPSDRTESLNQHGCSSPTERDWSGVNLSKHTGQSVGKSNSSAKLRPLFGCNCIVDDYLYNKTLEEYCLSNGSSVMRNSTPNESVDQDKMADDLENSRSTTYHSCLDNIDQNSENQRGEFTMDNSLPLIEKLLQNDLNILKSIRRDNQLPKLENKQSSNDKPMHEVFKISDILKELNVTRNVVTNFEILKVVEPDEGKDKLKADDEIQKTMVSMSVTDGIKSYLGLLKSRHLHIFSVVNTVQRSEQNTERNVVKVSSFGDANIPRFFKDSMKVFDGCYEKDFANNTELQCLLRQLEKKKWSIFPAQLGQDALIPSNVLKEQNDQDNSSSTVRDLRIVGLPNDCNFSTMKRYGISEAIYDEHLAPEIIQMNEQSLDDFSVVLSNALKPSVASYAKDAYTQTENDDQRSKSSTSNLAEAQKRHRKTFFKFKRPKEPSEEKSVSPIANLRERKSDSRDSKRLPAAQKSEKSTKPAENPKKQSDESVCECRALSRKQSSDRRREINKKCTARCKVETFGTIPFSQVVRPAIFDSVIHRRKPYPRRTKDEPGNVLNGANSKRTSPTLKKLSDASKTAVHNSRKFKWKNRVGNESSEEREAREMKALKAYNEVTLLKDKKELEARKRPIVGRQLTAVANPESSKTHWKPRSRKNKPDRCRRNVDDYLDKENLFVDATTETEPLLSKNGKTFVTMNDGRKSLLSEKYSCSSKLAKVNKIADKLLLDNFNRLRGEHTNQSMKRSKRIDEVERQKQHTKYSKQNKLTKEEEEESNDGSMVSTRKLEGTQKGRELERMPAKKDVRDPLKILAVSSHADSFSSRILVENERDKETSTSVNLSVDFSAQAGHLLTVVKPTTQDVASSWSSSTVDQEDEPYFPEQDDANTQTIEHGATLEEKHEPLKTEEKHEPLKTEDYKKENELVSKTREDVKEGLVPVPEIKDQPSARFQAIFENQQEETDSILKTEDQPKEFESEDQAKGIEPISDTEEHREETSNIRNDCQEQVKEDKTEETKESKVLSEPIEEGETEVPRDEAKGDNLEVLQNEPETISRRIISNLSDLGGIDINYVILNSSDASRENDTPVWDIVDEETVRTLHNMFAYRSLDASFDLSGEFYTMEEVLNGRQMVSSSSSLDDFIFQSSRDLWNLPMYEHTVFRVIRPHRRDVEEAEDEISLCDFCITAIDHEDLPEIDSLEIHDLGDDEEHSIEDCLRFVKEDIFTNIKFPVVINLTDAMNDEKDPEDTELDLDITLEQAEPSKTNFSLMDDRREEDGEEIDDEDEETTRNKYLETLQRFSPIPIVDSYDAFGRVLHEESGASYSKVSANDHVSIASRASNNMKRYMLVRSEPVQVRRGSLNRTYEILEEIDTEEEPVNVGRSIDSEELDEIVTVTEDAEEVEKSTKEIEKIYKYEDVEVDATRVEECKKETEKIDENVQLVELEGEEDQDSLERTNSNESSDFEVDEQRIVSLYTILTFLVLVFCFYVRYFYQKIFLFKEASTSTSTLKPFDIHAVPTSTATFLENSTLMDQTEEEKHDEETEEELEEDDSFDRIVNLKMIDVSQFDEYDSVMNFDSTQYGALSNSPRVRRLGEDNSKEIEEESALCLKRRIFGDIEICPNESQEGEVETSVESDSRIQSVFLASNSELGVIEKPASESSTVEPKELEGDSLELRLAAKEIETFRYGEDDDSSLSEFHLTRDDETKSFDELREAKVTTDAGEDQTSSCGTKFVEVRERSSKDQNEEEKGKCSTVERNVEKARTLAKRDECSSSPRTSEANFMEMKIVQQQTSVLKTLFLGCVVQFIPRTLPYLHVTSKWCPLTLRQFCNRGMQRINHLQKFLVVSKARPTKIWERLDDQNLHVDLRENAANVVLRVSLAERGDIDYRDIVHHSIDHLADSDLHSERRMENDNNRRAGPEHRQNHLRDKPVHDDLDLHVAHYRRPQEKYVYDATVGSSGPNISDQSVGEHPVHVDHVLRESRGNKWNSVARHWPRSCCDLHVLVVGSVQLFPVPENTLGTDENGFCNYKMELTASVIT